MALHFHKISARVTGGTVLPRLVRFGLALGWGHKPEQVRALESEIAHRLGVPSARVAQRDGDLCIEVPRPDRGGVSLWALCRGLPEIPARTAVLGVSERGRGLLLRLTSPDVAHVLVAGTTGSGKTALTRTMALSLAMHNRQGEVQLAVIDPKGRGFAALASLPHLLTPVIDDVDHAAHFLDALVVEMLARDRERAQEPRIVVVLDELADLVEAGGPGVLAAVTRLTQRGRGAGIHLVACTQKPTADAIGGLVKSNFPARLVGSVASAADAALAAGMPGTGAERLLGRGDFLLVVKGDVTRFQAAYAGQKEARAIVARLLKSPRQSRRFVTEYPLEEPRGLLAAPGLPAASRWTPRVVTDNRGDRVDEDARRVMAEPGFTEDWVDGDRFRYGYQAVIGRIVGQNNAGAGRRHILAVARRVLDFVGSTSTGGELSDPSPGDETRAVPE